MESSTAFASQAGQSGRGGRDIPAMTLTDTNLMWASFNVPETQYLEYIAAKAQRRVDPKIGLELGDGSKFKHPGEIGAILAEFDDKTGGIRFRADFANPGRRLRHGETGTVLMRQTHRGATVIPKRSAYEIQDKRYVNVVDKEDVVHRREIAVVNETGRHFPRQEGPWSRRAASFSIGIDRYSSAGRSSTNFVP